MQQDKISDLPELAVAAPDDMLEITDVSTTSSKHVRVATLLQVLYPVGSIYTNATDSTNPGTLFGFGTWEAFGAGRVPVGFNAAETEFNSAEKTGGAKTVTLTEAQMPTHNHRLVATISPGQAADPEDRLLAQVSGHPQYRGLGSEARRNMNNAAISDSGGGQPHNNLQPYITVYMWKRTA